MQATERVAQFNEYFKQLREEIGKVIVGQEEIVTGVITCLIANGHALLEGVPGTAKTIIPPTKKSPRRGMIVRMIRRV